MKILNILSVTESIFSFMFAGTRLSFLCVLKYIESREFLGLHEILVDIYFKNLWIQRFSDKNQLKDFQFNDI